MKQFVGSGVAIDRDGRLCLPDGLDPDRVHRFIELCMADSFDSPKSAMHSLFGHVGVAPEAIAALNDVLGDAGDLDWSAIGRSPMKLSLAVPRLLDIPHRFRAFLVEGLALADPASTNLEQAVVSTRVTVASSVGCRAHWDTILQHTDAVSELASDWRVATLR
ncbi:MAG: hypothetical protein GY944_08720 [bacterium]|nr:hypothetical protein [bacterium]MCP5041102.1 hypothetical protein [bacterium]